MRNPLKRKLTVRRLLEKGQQIIIDQGEVSIGFGTKERTCAVGALGLAYNGSLTSREGVVLDAVRKLNQAAFVLYGRPSAGAANDIFGYTAARNMYNYAIAHA